MLILLLTHSFNSNNNAQTSNSFVNEKMIFTQFLPLFMYQIGFQYLVNNQNNMDNFPSLNDFLSKSNENYTPIFEMIFHSQMCSYLWWYLQFFLLERFENWFF